MMKLFIIILSAFVTLSSCSVVTFTYKQKRTIKNYQEIHTENNIDVDFIEKHDSHFFSDSISPDGKFKSLTRESTVFKLTKPGYVDKYVLWPEKKAISLYVDYTIAAAIMGFSGYLLSQEITIERIGGILAGGMMIAIAEVTKYKNTKKTSFPDSLVKQISHNDRFKYMSFGEVQIDAANIETSTSKSKKHYENNKINRRKQSNVKLKQAYSPRKINHLLYESGYYDTTNLLRSDLNKLVIDATIYEQNKISLKHPKDVAKYEFKIRYDFRESFTDSIIFSHKDSIVTDFHYDGPKFKKELVDQGVIKGFYNIIKSSHSNKQLLKQKFEEEKTDPIKINADSTATFYGEAISACVTIKVDKGHGSGFFISNDGYIITNLHVVGNTKNIEVILNNGEKMTGELVRKSIKHDLALIKVATNSDVCLELDRNEETEIFDFIGEKVFVIGTPNNVQLGQSVSRGVLSGYRDYQNVKYYQTDASINGGNSGGPMILENGKVLGVVNAKLIGANVERIGFAIPSKYIFEALNLYYD